MTVEAQEELDGQQRGRQVHAVEKLVVRQAVAIDGGQAGQVRRMAFAQHLGAGDQHPEHAQFARTGLAAVLRRQFALDGRNGVFVEQGVGHAKRFPKSVTHFSD